MAAWRPVSTPSPPASKPKIRTDDLTPVEWPDEPGLEWCPPGHGDLYTALVTSGMLEDLLAIELMLAHDLLAVASTQHVLGDGTDAALRMVQDAITAADPRADAVHHVLRERFPVRQADEFAASDRSAAR